MNRYKIKNKVELSQDIKADTWGIILKTEDYIGKCTDILIEYTKEGMVGHVTESIKGIKTLKECEEHVIKNMHPDSVKI